MPPEIQHIKILSPAKINLFLQVTAKRPDGFHELFTLMCCVRLFDTVTINIDRRDIAVMCDHPNVPDGDKNIAWLAADLFMKHLKKTFHI